MACGAGSGAGVLSWVWLFCMLPAALLPACGGHAPSGGSGGAPGADAATGSGGTSGTAGDAGSSSSGGTDGSGSTVADTGSDRSSATSDVAADPPPASTDAADAPADGTCATRTYALSALPPDVLILLDRSGSMSNDSNDQVCPASCVGGSKWTQAGAATNQVVAQTASQIRWGMKFFPESGTCGVTAGVAVVPQPGAAGAIATAIASVAPMGSTPTRTAIQGAAAALGAITESNPKFIVLVTDGQPNCMPGSPTPNAADDVGAIQAVSSVASAGISTFVVGVGTAALASVDATLSQMAFAGGRPRDAVPAYYPVSDTSGLVAALSTIASAAVSCTFALPVALADPTQVTVTTSTGAPIPHDASNGWTYSVSSQSITLMGSWCAQVRAGTLSALQVVIPC